MTQSSETSQRYAQASAKAYAKINLRLRILARETSGYHSIETVFHRLELADDIRVSLSSPDVKTITCSVDVGPAEENLAFRAALAYVRSTQWNVGFAIDIVKRIPARGGLGGGSADAAATLRAFNLLNPKPLAKQALIQIAASLGADVPFLTSDAVMALAWGRGERMLALDPLPERWIALVVPSFGVNTREAYEWVAVKAGDRSTLDPLALHPWHLANWSELLPLCGNDFTSVVAERHPFVDSALEALRKAGAVIAEMSGSGSTVYGIFDREPSADSLEKALGAPVVVTKTARAVEAERRID